MASRKWPRCLGNTEKNQRQPGERIEFHFRLCYAVQVADDSRKMEPVNSSENSPMKGDPHGSQDNLHFPSGSPALPGRSGRGAAIENVCDNLCEDLAEALSPARLTPRFSPGYGDFPLSQQAALCAVLNAERRIGLTLTPGGLLLPQKSVTAVIGVSDAPAARGRDSAEDSHGSGAPGGCASCSMYAHCSFRREGSSCGKP